MFMAAVIARVRRSFSLLKHLSLSNTFIARYTALIVSAKQSGLFANIPFGSVAKPESLGAEKRGVSSFLRACPLFSTPSLQEKFQKGKKNSAKQSDFCLSLLKFNTH